MPKKTEKVLGGIIEGGPLKCPRHDFETTSLSEWNDHCSDGDHFEQGSTVCASCGESFDFEHLPYVPFKPDGSKGFDLKCDECNERSRGNVKMTKSHKVETTA